MNSGGGNPPDPRPRKSNDNNKILLRTVGLAPSDHLECHLCFDATFVGFGCFAPLHLDCSPQVLGFFFSLEPRIPFSCSRSPLLLLPAAHLPRSLDFGYSCIDLPPLPCSTSEFVVRRLLLLRLPLAFPQSLAFPTLPRSGVHKASLIQLPPPFDNRWKPFSSHWILGIYSSRKLRIPLRKLRFKRKGKNKIKLKKPLRFWLDQCMAAVS